MTGWLFADESPISASVLLPANDLCATSSFAVRP